MGLGKEIEGVQLEGAQGRPHAAGAGHGDHVDRGMAAFDLAEHLGPVHAGHDQVQQNHVHGGFFQAFEALLRGKSVGDFVAVFRERPVQGVGGGTVVVDDQDFQGDVGGGLGGGHGVPRGPGGPFPRAGRGLQEPYTPPAHRCQGGASITAPYGR